MSPRHDPADHGSTLARLRDWLEHSFRDEVRPVGFHVPDPVVEFIDAMDGGDALLVRLRAAPYADDELRTLAEGLGDDVTVLRLPPEPAPDSLGDVVWVACDAVTVLVPGGDPGVALRAGDDDREVLLDADDAHQVGLALLAGAALDRARAVEEVDG